MCIWHCLASTYPQPREKTCEDGEEYFWWNRSWQRAASVSVWGLWEWCMGVLRFSATGRKCSESVSKFSFTIVIVFTVIKVSIKYHDSSKFHYHPALIGYMVWCC